MAHVPGEIYGCFGGSPASDGGFLRLSAGGGTSVGNRAYIDLSGYSATADLNNSLVFGTVGQECMRLNLNGLLSLARYSTTTNNYTSDSSAAGGGVPLGGIYHNAGALRVRIV